MGGYSGAQNMRPNFQNYPNSQMGYMPRPMGNYPPGGQMHMNGYGPRMMYPNNIGGRMPNSGYAYLPHSLGQTDLPAVSPRMDKTISKLFCKMEFSPKLVFRGCLKATFQLCSPTVPFNHSPVPGNPTPPLTPNGPCVGVPFASPASSNDGMGGSASCSMGGAPLNADTKPKIPTPADSGSDFRLTFPVRDGVILSPFRLEHNLAVSNHVFHLKSQVYQVSF